MRARETTTVGTARGARRGAPGQARPTACRRALWLGLGCLCWLSAGCEDSPQGAETAASAEPAAGASAAAAPASAAPTAAPKATAAPAATAKAWAQADTKCKIRAERDCEKQCLAGDGPSCAMAAFMLSENKPEAGQKDDPALRAKLNKKGCELGDLVSCWRLANQYREGEGVSKDEKKALELYADGCAKAFDYSCRSMGFSYYFYRPGDYAGREQDLDKALKFFAKGCALGDEISCEKKGRLERGNVVFATTMADLLASPDKWVDKRVGLRKVGVMRISPSSGTVYAPGSSPITDGVSVVLADDDETRKKWLAIPGGVGKKTVVSYVEALVEKQMARDTRLRLVIVDVGKLQ